jgi:hypothetical protein
MCHGKRPRTLPTQEVWSLIRACITQFFEPSLGGKMKKILTTGFFGGEPVSILILMNNKI